MTMEQGERQSLARKQRACLLSAAPAADIGGDYVKYRILKPRFYVKYRVLHIFFVSLDANWYESHSRGYGPVFRGCRAARQS